MTSIFDADVSVLAGNACNARHVNGCMPMPVPARMGGNPSNIAIDQALRTFYVPDNGDGNVSLFQLGR